MLCPTHKIPDRLRSLVAALLTDKPIPKGTESKYSNTLDFFDYVEKKQDLDRTFFARGS
jgi:hypothetical protein